MAKYEDTLPTGLTYARAPKTTGFTDLGHPRNGSTDWSNLVVFDRKTRKELGDVIEVDTAQNWLRRYSRDRKGKLLTERDIDGKGDIVYKTERLEGQYDIRQRNITGR